VIRGGEVIAMAASLACGSLIAGCGTSLASRRGVPAPVTRSPTDTLAYDFTPLDADGTRRDIGVTLSFPSGPAGVTTLVLPSAWAGQPDLYRAITALTATTSDVRITPTADSSRWTVVAPAGRRVTVSYRLHQDWSGALAPPLYHRAVAGRDLMVLVGENSLVYPQYSPADSVIVETRWLTLPDGWRVASSFGDGSPVPAHTTVRDLQESLFIGGLLRWQALTVRGHRVLIASAGASVFPDSVFTEMTASLMGRERAFWSDDATDYYLVARIQIARSGGGTAFTHALAMYADSGIPASSFGQTLAHEMFHEWNGRRFRLVGTDSTEGSTKWFSEGFTDFYADRIVDATGVMTHAEVLRNINRAIREYYLSPVRNTPQDSVAARYWSDPNMKQLPYQQGYVIAGYLNALVHRATAAHLSLDSVMRTIMRHASADGTFTQDEFIRAFPQSVRRDVRGALARFIQAGQTIPVEAIGFGSCLAVEQQPRFAFDLGFDADISARERVVSGVRPGSAAERAGLRNGMTLGERNWHDGNADSSAAVTVTDAAGDTRTIRYLPRSVVPVMVPHLIAGPCTD